MLRWVFLAQVRGTRNKEGRGVYDALKIREATVEDGDGRFGSIGTFIIKLRMYDGRPGD